MPRQFIGTHDEVYGLFGEIRAEPSHIDLQQHRPCRHLAAARLGSKLEARLAQAGDLRGKKTKFRPGKKWLDIGSVLEHDFTRH
jgi:hypothetical protein